MLTTVTITGADDRTDPGALIALSKEFPFVEWALLLSASRMGTPRYPSRAWLMEFQDAVAESAVARPQAFVHHAIHFCGQCTRDTLAGDSRWMDDVQPERIQLNGFKRTDAFVMLAQRLAVDRPSMSFILQAQDPASLETFAAVASDIGGKTSVLHDPSGGRGIETIDWPRMHGVRMGYAGGIGPSNVDDVLRRLYLDRSRGDFWIDMESRVRTEDDKLDMARVCMVLSKAQRCMQEAS